MLAEEDDADDVEATCRVLLVEGAAEESSWDEPNDRSRGSPVPLTEITSFQTKKTFILLTVQRNTVEALNEQCKKQRNLKNEIFPLRTPAPQKHSC